MPQRLDCHTSSPAMLMADTGPCLISETPKAPTPKCPVRDLPLSVTALWSAGAVLSAGDVHGSLRGFPPPLLLLLFLPWLLSC